MGLNNRFVAELAALKRRGALTGSSVIEIGAQQLSNPLLRDHDALKDLFGLFARKMPDLGSPIDEGYLDGIERLSDESPSSRALWEALGFSYTAIEFDGHRDSIPLDLNRDPVPSRMRGVFDLVVNTGTTEHVANQDHAFAVMHDLCKQGGVIYHELPAGGMMTHGLFTYTPKFFWNLCRENGYEPLTLKTIYCGSGPVPQNVRDSNVQFAGEDTIGIDVVPDCAIVAALRKPHDRPFVTPLDVPPEIMPPSAPVEPRAAKAFRRLKRELMRLQRAVARLHGRTRIVFR